MTTATTTTAVDCTSTAGFQAWVAEVIAQLLAVGLTQTADTGQINTSTVAKPSGTNTSAGYAVFAFNDALQATAPIYIRLEFGTGNSAASPQMWITVGSATNGAGTLTGTVSARVVVCNGSSASSPSNLYVSRFMYNATYGCVGMAWKVGGISSYANQTIGGFYIFRSNDATGAPTGAVASWLTNSYGTSASGSSPPNMQCLCFALSTVYPSAVSYGSFFTLVPFGNVSNPSGGDVQMYPVLYMAPLIAISAFAGICNMADIGMGGTFNLAVVGSTALTFINFGQMFGSYSIVSSYAGGTNSGQGFCGLWM